MPRKDNETVCAGSQLNFVGIPTTAENSGFRQIWRTWMVTRMRCSAMTNETNSHKSETRAFSADKNNRVDPGKGTPRPQCPLSSQGFKNLRNLWVAVFELTLLRLLMDLKWLERRQQRIPMRCDLLPRPGNRAAATEEGLKRPSNYFLLRMF
ncbi:hypothetical protein TGRUB_231175 [Toxoplasma gondii RUB]|uniref:Uncharacterized protein n=2 Tax=Toxoplasma gondii TaxID=5811 RepID=A0A086M453_TOXGO|nr:hypothetical protein TGRUB_231175 [Toxoplasma gondii RUB]KFH11087.1 hypothetical protein TGVAND_231175 [Toxoplasma gondii VAND]